MPSFAIKLHFHEWLFFFHALFNGALGGCLLHCYGMTHYDTSDLCELMYYRMYWIASNSLCYRM